jgi:hypothetical protein
MPRARPKASVTLIDQMLGEASWLLSHAQALSDYGRDREASVELARAAGCEEQVACLLESKGQCRDAAIHRVSAATCYEKLGQYARTVTLLHAALSGPLPDDYRGRIEKQLNSALARAQKQMNHATLRRPRKQPSSGAS